MKAFEKPLPSGGIANPIHRTKAILRVRIALVGGGAEPQCGLRAALRHAMCERMKARGFIN